MQKFGALRIIVIAAGLATVSTACKSEDARDTERSAERVRAKSADVKQEQQELGKAIRASAKDVVDEAGDVMRKQAELSAATADFERKKAARIANLEGQLSILASMPELITAMSRGPILTAAEKVKLDEKLQILRVRIDEAKLLVPQLQGTTAATWTTRDDEVTRALSRIDDARDDAIEVVEDASDRPGS